MSHKRHYANASTSQACVECNRSKTRCGDARPCNRCLRIGLICHDSPRKNRVENMSVSLVAAHNMQPASIKFPAPDINVMYESLCKSMETLSPFAIADFFIDEQTLWFISTIGCLRSLIPHPRTMDFTRRLFERSSFSPLEQKLALGRLSYIHDSSQIPTDGNAMFNLSPPKQPLMDLFHLSDDEFVYHFMHSHVFNASLQYSSPPVAGVLVSMFKRDVLTGKVTLSHFVSPVAETIYGYTSEQFASLSTEFGSTSDYNANEFPQSLCHIHNEDVFAYCSGSLRAFLNPGQEIQVRIRVIHASGVFIPCNSSQIVLLYEDGGIRSVVTQFIPDST